MTRGTMLPVTAVPCEWLQTNTLTNYRHVVLLCRPPRRDLYRDFYLSDAAAAAGARLLMGDA